ncbi:MAG: fimbria/pilus periplasmic chaperone [Steroidobacteraceae bacterium]
MNLYQGLRRISITCSVLCGAALLGAAPSRAGNFSVSPLRVEMKGSHRLEVLTITNADDAPLSIQIELKNWTQQAGEEQLDETHDLLVTPPIFRMAPHGQQVVRIALRRDADPLRELDYRVLLTEIPAPPSKDFSGMQVALQLSLPIFVAPPVFEHSELNWTAKWLADGTVQISASNSGNAHTRVTDFDVQFGSENRATHVGVTRYVLPQSSVSWIVKPPEGSEIHSALKVRGASDRGDFSAGVTDAGA